MAMTGLTGGALGVARMIASADAPDAWQHANGLAYLATSRRSS